MRVNGSRNIAILTGLVILCVLAAFISPCMSGLPAHLRVKGPIGTFTGPVALTGNPVVGVPPISAPAPLGEIFRAVPPVQLTCVRIC
jgi:hypothetical protein